MIVTVTPNPSIDRSLTVPEFRRGQVNRADDVGLEPSGKGINVALALLGQKHSVRAVFPSGGTTGQMLIGELELTGLEVDVVPIQADIRSNVSVIEPRGVVTKINELGPELSGVEARMLNDTAVKAAADADWLVGSGSLPSGVEDGFYARLVRSAHEARVRCAIDSSGPALLAAAEAGADLIKPNVEELSALVHRRLTTLGDVQDAANEVLAAGARRVLASLGRDGALLVTSQGTLHGEVTVHDPRNSVGAGDALLAGYLAADGHGAATTSEETTRLAEALRWAGAAVRSRGTLLGDFPDHSSTSVRIHVSVDRSLPLSSQNTEPQNTEPPSPG